MVRAHGGPEVLSYEERPALTPGPGEVVIKNHAIGLNFIDTYQRTGLYQVPLPFVPGSEGAGEVTAIAEDVSDVKVGDRVTYYGRLGSYAEECLMPAGRTAKIPDGIDYETAAAVTLKGITAYYLLFQTWPLAAGESILVHAAAGGVGQILTRWAKALGATVYGTAGGSEKVALVRAAGADEAIDYHVEDFAARVRELTGGRGVDVVYDGVGKATFDGSLDSLKPRGLMVSYGNASGPVSIPSLVVLSVKGSLYLTRPTAATYTATTEELRNAIAAVFEAVQSGVIEVAINQRFALADAAAAHRALEARETTGSTILIP